MFRCISRVNGGKYFFCGKIRNIREYMLIKNLARNINILNLSLSFIAILFALYIFLPSLSVKAIVTLPPATKQKIEVLEETYKIKTPSPADYVKVSEENLFHPDRKIPAPPEKIAEKQLPKPEFVLYGTLITDELRLAYLEDTKAPRNTPGRGKRQAVMKKGDTISGFTIKEIESDHIIMTRDDETITLKVTESKKSRTIQTTPQTKEQQPPKIPAPRQRGSSGRATR